MNRKSHQSHNMYEKKKKSRTCLNGALSDFLCDTLGVNQGGSSSPTTFVDSSSDLSDYLTQTCGMVISRDPLLPLLGGDDLILVSNTDLGLQKQIDNQIIWNATVMIMVLQLVLSKPK